MLNRQENAAKYSTTLLGIAVSLLLILYLQACTHSAQTAEATQTPEPTESAVQIDPSHTASPTPEMTPSTAVLTNTATPACLQTAGELISHQFYSNILGTDFQFHLYLPPCYHAEDDLRYPVVYLLHGLARTNDQWLRLGVVGAMDSLIAAGEIPPFIIVLPLETDFNPPQISLYPDAIVDELIPWVDGHYDTLPERQFRAIGGVSRGAAWAVSIGIKYHDVFSKVGAHSLPLFEADGANLITWILQTPPEDLPAFFIDIGRDDQEWKTAQDFANLLDIYNVPHEWYLFRYGHTEAYWSSHLAHYLRWYGRDW